MESNWVPYMHDTDSLNGFYEKNNTFHFFRFFWFLFCVTSFITSFITSFWIGSAWNVLT